MTHALARRPRRHVALPGVLVLLACACILAGATGFGATTSTQTPSATVVGMLALTDPTAKSADPPLCTAALAPIDTDACSDVTFTTGATKVLDLGELSGSDVQAGSLKWLVTTTNPTGYEVQMSNPGAAPLLQGSAGSIPDMATSPLVPAASVPDATQFGVAIGDPATDSEAAVAFTGSPWVTSGGQQGELFSGIPSTGMVIAQQTAPVSNDPFTATFAVAAVAGQQPLPGSYGGTVRLVATALP